MCYSLILRNIVSTCWRVLDQSVSELTNMERLDITLTKFIKLHVLLLMLGLGYILRSFQV